VGFDPQAGVPAVRIEGRRVALHGAVPGELALVARPRGRGGSVSEILEVCGSSPDRVEPRCRHEGVCGGCGWQHLRYDAQLRLKRERLEHLLRAALGSAVPPVAPVIAAEGGTRDETGAPWGFRSKVHFVCAAEEDGRLALGHYRRGTSAPLPVVECPVHVASGNDTAFAVREALRAAGIEAWSSGRGRGVARHLVVRVAPASGERLATLVVADAADPRLRRVTRAVLASPAAPDGWHLNVHAGRGPWLFGAETRRLHGRARLREHVAGATFLVSPTAFFQTNTAAAGALVDVVLEAIRAAGAREVLDLYAGAGLFALPLARAGCRVTAVESDAGAVADGEASRAFSQIDPRACRFVGARAGDYVARRQRAGRGVPRLDAIVLDPPRDGCGGDLLAGALDVLDPSCAIYVSCEPLALVRDLSALRAAGLLGGPAARHAIVAVQPVDMFPHTPHLETVVVLRRR
jgi:23S rRNA (uracil1939-C5)-methyltransferase